jgi:hypothetical protein
MSDATSIRMRVSNNAPIRMETSAKIGAINCVTGEFTTGENSGVETIHVPYKGNGYPVGLFIAIKSGVDEEPFASLDARSAIGAYMVLKAAMNVPPDYNDGDNDKARCVKIGKNVPSSSIINTAFTAETYRQERPDVGAYNALRISSAKDINIYVRSGANGFLANTTYKYCVWYSE